jgi:hypothetical protein
MTISSVCSTCHSSATQAQSNTHPTKNSTSTHQPEDTVSLSSQAQAKLKGGDPDHDGD